MEELFNMTPEQWDVRLSEMYESNFPTDMIEESMARACDFFHADLSKEVEARYATAVSFEGPNTYSDEILFFNLAQLNNMGITGQDGLDLVMTHEGTRLMFQDMGMNLNHHQEELCCDYMVGVRAGLNGVDISHLMKELENMKESETLPEGTFRAAAIQSGLEFAKQFEQRQPPTFNECIEDFNSGNMHDIMELEHLKSEMNSHECSMRHYQRALENDPDNEKLIRQFHQSEADYNSTKQAFSSKYSETALHHLLPNNILYEYSDSMSDDLNTLQEFSSDVSSEAAKVESCQNKVNSLYSKLNSLKSNSDEYREVKKEYDKAQAALSNAREDYKKAVQYAHQSGTL